MTEVRHGRRAASRHAAYRIESPCPTPGGKHALPPKPDRPPTPVVIAEPIEVVPALADMVSPTNTGTMPRTKLWKARTIATAVTTGGLLLASGTVATPEASRSVTRPIPIIPTITAPDVPLPADRVEVKTEPAPPPPPPAPVPPPAVQAAPVPVVPAPQPVPAPVVPTPSRAANVVVQAALNQVGVNQDCTMLVTNSLAAVGINFHGWPWQYQPALGYYIPASQALPGDLIYYNNGGSPGPQGIWDHIAVYIGNGQAVHGGFNGNQTIVFSVNVIGAGPNFIRVA